MTHTKKHQDRMTRRREEQHSRVRTTRYRDTSKYKGSRTPTDWYGFRLELVAEGIKEIGKVRT